MTDVNKLIREGRSLDYVLEAVKAEYAAAAKREAEKEREAKAKALKVEASRNALLKAMDNYLIVLADGDMTIVECSKELREDFERDLKQAEKNLQLIREGGSPLSGIYNKALAADDKVIEKAVNNLLSLWGLDEDTAVAAILNGREKMFGKQKNSDDVALQNFLDKICK